jgi:hypothetical protein
MATTVKVTDLALEFDEALDSGARPDVRAFLARVSRPEDRSELLVQLLACEAGYTPWDASALKTRLSEFEELRADPTLALEVLRLVYADRVMAHEPLEWSAFAPFGLDAGTARLACLGEGHYLGERLQDRYLLEQRIGAGTYGLVFRATDLESGHKVALKTPHYPRKPELALAMLSREIQVAGRLNHPAIVSVLASRTDEAATAFLVMKYFEGGSLLARMKGPLPPDQALRLLIPVAEALGHAHQREIFHRDVKPENILLDGEGNSHVSDFGFALSMDEQWNKEGEVAGTFAYMAPELLLGSTHQIDGRSDIWSLGIILYEMLTGDRLAKENTREEALVASVMHGAAQELSFPDVVPSPLRRICERCLRRDPNLRYDTAEELAKRMQEAIGVGEMSAGASGRAKETPAVCAAAWKVGAELGFAFSFSREYADAIRNVQSALPAEDEKLERRLIAAVGEAAMHQVASVNHYEGCAAVAPELGIEIAGLPKEQRDCTMLIYQARALTSGKVRKLPQQATDYLGILEHALASLRERLLGSGERVYALFEMARVGADPACENASSQFEHSARRSSVSQELWNPFLNLLLAGSDLGTLREAFNRLDKLVQRHLLHGSES